MDILFDSMMLLSIVGFMVFTGILFFRWASQKFGSYLTAKIILIGYILICGSVGVIITKTIKTIFK